MGGKQVGNIINSCAFILHINTLHNDFLLYKGSAGHPQLLLLQHQFDRLEASETAHGKRYVALRNGGLAGIYPNERALPTRSLSELVTKDSV